MNLVFLKFLQSFRSLSSLHFFAYQLIKANRFNRYLYLFFSLGLLTVPCRSDANNDNDSLVIIKRIIVAGNHKTKIHIITREYTFHEGDTMPISVYRDAVRNTRFNLMNTGLFNFVDINSYQTEPGLTDVVVDVTERWYLFPLPIFELADRNFNEWWLRRDFNRTNYGFNIRQENFRGRDEILQVNCIFGYTQKLGIYYTIPYINKQQKTGLSGGITFSRNHEISYNTTGNKLQFYKDKDAFVKEEKSIYLRLSKRNGIYQYFNTMLEVKNIRVKDTIVKLNPEFFVSNASVQNSITIYWQYLYDHRDYQPYALKGYLFALDIYKIGLGLLNNEPDMLLVAGTFKKYQMLTPRITAAAMLKVRVTQKEDAPYFNQRALGYVNDYIRGYDYYVINGQNFSLFRSTLRYTALKTTQYLIPYIRSEKFSKVPVAVHLTGFFDAGYVSDNRFGNQNPISNTLQYSYGFGVDYVTYYDLVFRLEYGWNKLHEHGFYFRIGACI